MTMNNKRNAVRSILTALSASLCAFGLQAQEPRFVDQADDERLLPFDGHVLTDRGDAQIVRFRNWDRFNPVREIRAGDYTLELEDKAMDWSDFTYEVEGETFTLEDYMVKNHTGGVLVIKDGDLLLERYGLGNSEDTLWISFSVSKSVTSMLLGAAIQEGYIKRTSRGREATDLAYKHLNLEKPGQTGTLFD